MSEFDEYSYTQEFIDLAKGNDKCIYKQFNLCIE